ncbi:SPX domain-containing membrane protein [Sesamum alatum]|uniref:SPX domain-containing membrane protein n=1 Tax=Sesamum alatum TaxID=300844 RepID=A0AAE1Y3T3_9LAMI|nr:SPX domain-containing membrane protein [Sesamum alatum]
MVNTYIIVPTADDYSTSLGAAATVCGVVIGAMAVAQVFSSVYFSAWSNKSYFRPLVFSSIVLCAGNAMYAMAYDLKSLSVLLLGRLLCGVGTQSLSECEESEEAPEDSRRPANSLGSAYRLLTPSVKVQLLIYFMLKYAMEDPTFQNQVLLRHNYFGWTTGTVSIFLACLGLTVLPVNIVVGSYISNMYEDRQILLASEIMVLLGIIFSFNFIIPYSVPQYVCSGLIMFVSAEVLEGVNLSLLSRVMSSRLSRGTYNGGLLSTEAGTLARVVADATITIAGLLGQSMLLNITLLPSLVICIVSIIATCCTYNSLY